jgi:rhodanese-related sulfurtransferase
MTTFNKALASTAGVVSLLVGTLALFVTKTRSGYNQLIDIVYDSEFPDIRTITTEELAASLGSSRPPILLDARSPEEYAVSHIRNAQLVNASTFSRDDVDDIERDREVVVYCSIGHRSGKVARRMRQMGFVNVRNLHGGIFSWYNEERPVFSRETPVDRIHPFDWLWGQFITRGGKTTSPA